MEWILNNLQVLFVVAIAVVAILQRLKKAPEGEEPRRPGQAAPDGDERTRRIQEEIRRRIMERRGLAPAGQGGEVPRAFPPAPPMIEEIRPVRVEPPPHAAAASAAMAAEFKRQQEMIERVRELDAARRARAAAAAEPAPAGIAAADHSDRLLPDLHSRGGLRRAIVLREVLGPPVGLR